MPKRSYMLISFLLIIFFALIAVSHFYANPSRDISYANENPIIINHNAGMAEYNDIAVNANGDGVIVWQHKNKDWDIYAQLLRKGEKEGDAIKVNQYSLNNQQLPQADMDENGNFAVVWQSYVNEGSGSDIYAQRFNADGKKLSNEFRLNSDIRYNQISPDIVMQKDGSFAISWASEAPKMQEYMTTYFKNIHAKFFNPDGTQKTDEMKVSANNYELNTEPAMAVNDAGETIIVWQAYNDNNNWDIYSQSFNKDGVKKSADNTLVNSITAYDQTLPGVSVGSSGNFIVVWANKQAHPVFDRLMENITGQALNSSGARSGPVLVINKPVLYERHTNPSISYNGELSVVAWQTYIDDQWRILYQYLDKQNNISGEIGELTASNTDDKIWDLDPVVLMQADGKFNIAWTQYDLNAVKKNVVYMQYDSEIAPVKN